MSDDSARRVISFSAHSSHAPALSDALGELAQALPHEWRLSASGLGSDKWRHVELEGPDHPDIERIVVRSRLYRKGFILAELHSG